ncbi:MAG: helix-hairpin-helix domain-containing protein [Nocardioidaceae bacterium]
MSWGASTFAVLAVTIALGLSVTAWWVLRAGRPVSVVPAAAPGLPLAGSSSAPAGSTPAATDSGALASSTASPGGMLTVDVAGRVRHPGIVVLPAGSRVADAIKSAGGLSRGADRLAVNLAAPLVDGQQVLVGAPRTVTSPSGGTALPTGPGTLVNLNTADLATLDTLPEVGPVTAQAILSWRDAHGGFSSVDQLLEVDGIGEATLAKLTPLVTL